MPTAAGHGDQNPQVEETTENTSNGLTVDQVNQLVNKAISARLTASEKKMEASFKSLSESFAQTIKEQLSSLAPQKEQTATGTPGAIDPHAIAEHPLVKGMAKQVADMKASLETAKAERDAEAQRSRETAMRQSTSDALLRAGVAPERIKHAVGFLTDVEKRVRVGEDGSAVFRDADGTDVDFDTGLKSWLKSEDAKMYMAPRGVQGSGGSGGGKGPRPAQATESVGASLLKSVTNLPFIQPGQGPNV